MTKLVRPQFLALLAFALALLALSPACHNVKPDAFAGAVVDCAKVQPSASAALAGVETCLVGVATQNYAACLSGLISEGKFSIDEIACVVAWYAEQTNNKVGASTASHEELAARDRANAWLAQEQISIRNSYTTKPMSAKDF